MAEDRPKIPTPLRREVLEEAGYACAIPVCRIATVEIAHIEPWSKVKEHTFDNLIALCPNHHTLYDVEKKIPKASVLRYKANLAVLNGRYSDLERRVLEDAVAQRYGMANGMPVAPDPGMRQWTVHRGMGLLLSHLLKDGLIRKVLGPHGGLRVGHQEVEHTYVLTPKGIEFVRQWQDAEPLLE